MKIDNENLWPIFYSTLHLLSDNEISNINKNAFYRSLRTQIELNKVLNEEINKTHEN
jgi:hypothetical protein